jgi:hypothetical protein
VVVGSSGIEEISSGDKALLIVTVRALAVAFFVSLCLVQTTEAQDTDLDTTEGDAYRPVGPTLFPLYEHYLQTADNTTVRNILYLYVSTDSPDGSSSTLLAPFFYRSHDVPAAEDRLYLFPLLFFRKSGEEESFTYSIPLYYARQTKDTTVESLFPLWFYRKNAGVASLHALFPLFRYREDERDGSLENSRVVGIARHTTADGLHPAQLPQLERRDTGRTRAVP